MRTYQTRRALSSEQAALLDAYAALYGKAERSLFARLSAGESLSVLKRAFKRFPSRITAAGQYSILVDRGGP